MTTNKPTQEDLERGFTACQCDKGVLLHQAGYECPVRHCSLCGKWVADKELFFKFQTGAEVLSK